MKIYLLAAALALSLGGCAALDTLETGTSAVTNQNNLDAARAAYDGAVLAPAAKYRQLGYCATGTAATLLKPCADRSVVAKLQGVNSQVIAEFNNIQGMINAGNQTGVVAEFTVLNSLISTAEGIVATVGTL
jgi:hypothetical protein